MMARTLVVGVSGMLLACGSESGVETQTSAGGAEVLSIAGMYAVKGTTVEEGSGNERPISGTIILSQDGASYIATFSLNTEFPGEGGPTPADVIGKGEGTVEGTTLTGTAETQIVMSKVPGVDTQFAYIPRYVGPRLVSYSIARVQDDGAIEVEIVNQPAEGEDYVPTRTTLRGTRVSAARAIDSLPKVAAPATGPER